MAVFLKRGKGVSLPVRNMKFIRTIAILMAVALALGSVSCAVAPAKLERSHALGLASCPFEQESLHSLIELSLDTPNEGASAHALAHVVEAWHSKRDDAVSGVVSPAADSEAATVFHVRFTAQGQAKFLPGYFDELSPAVDYRVKKLERFTKDGVGAPMKALRENRGEEAIERFYPPEAITRELTAVIHPGRKRGNVREVEIELLCSLYHEDVVVSGRQKELAADYTVALAGLLERSKNLSRSEVVDLFTRTPSREPQLYLMEPYDPGKEPLLMIHGLLDSPLSWAELTNELRADPDLRARYQIWHYLYNTSAPALYSGRLLRAQYRELRHLLDPGLDDLASLSTTLVTHSMGGIVARSLITDPGDAFWKAGFNRSFESLTLTSEDREALREAFLWKPEASVKRVVFISVPHRGSQFADNPVGRFGRALVKPPNRFREFYERISVANPGAFTEEYAELGEGKLDSVSALSPMQPTLKLLPELPLGNPVVLHSIIGDRGREGLVEDSSDGVVAYWSSHLDSVASEKMIPHGHDALDKPETIAEVTRILKLR